jgi:hypothetical protein
VPVYRQRTYDAAAPAEACRQAIEDDDWSNDKLDYEAAGETYVTGIWLGADAAYSGAPVAVPSHFDETMQRKAVHFEVLFSCARWTSCADVTSSASARRVRVTAIFYCGSPTRRARSASRGGAR